jgi:hypothetical protein
LIHRYDNLGDVIPLLNLDTGVDSASPTSTIFDIVSVFSVECRCERCFERHFRAQTNEVSMVMVVLLFVMNDRFPCSYFAKSTVCSSFLHWYFTTNII